MKLVAFAVVGVLGLVAAAVEGLPREPTTWAILLVLWGRIERRFWTIEKGVEANRDAIARFKKTRGTDGR